MLLLHMPRTTNCSRSRLRATIRDDPSSSYNTIAEQHAPSRSQIPATFWGMHAPLKTADKGVAHLATTASKLRLETHVSPPTQAHEQFVHIFDFAD